MEKGREGKNRSATATDARLVATGASLQLLCRCDWRANGAAQASLPPTDRLHPRLRLGLGSTSISPDATVSIAGRDAAAGRGAVLPSSPPWPFAPSPPIESRLRSPARSSPLTLPSVHRVRRLCPSASLDWAPGDRGAWGAGAEVRDSRVGAGSREAVGGVREESIAGPAWGERTREAAQARRAGWVPSTMYVAVGPLPFTSTSSGLRGGERGRDVTGMEWVEM